MNRPMLEMNADDESVIDGEEMSEDAIDENDMEWLDRSPDEEDDPYDDLPDAFESIDERDIE